MRLLLRLLIASSVVLGLVACGGGKTNPLSSAQQKAQANTRAGKDPGNQLSQTYAPQDSMDIAIEGQTDHDFINGSEGNAISVRFKVTPQIAAITAVALDFGAVYPNGATLTLAKDEPNVWIFNWTPPNGLVPPSQSEPVTSNVSLIAHVADATDDAAKIFASTKTFSIYVNKTSITPTVSGINGLPKSINEGDNVHFNIIVLDKSGANPTVLKDSFDQGMNVENYKADGSTFVRNDPDKWPIESLGGGRWQFNYIFETEGRKIGYPLDSSGHQDTSANSLRACFNFRAENSYGNHSAPYPACVEINYSSQSPDVIWADLKPGQSSDLEVVAGTTATLNFGAKTVNGRGTTTVTNASVGFSKWPGYPVMTMNAPNPQDGSVAQGQIVWQVPCSTGKAKVFDLVLKASNEMSGKAKTNTVHRKITVTPSASCATTADSTPSTIAPAVKADVDAKPNSSQPSASSKKIAPKTLTSKASPSNVAPAKPAEKTDAKQTVSKPAVQKDVAASPDSSSAAPSVPSTPAVAKQAVVKTAAAKSAISKPVAKKATVTQSLAASKPVATKSAVAKKSAITAKPAAGVTVPSIAVAPKDGGGQ